MHSNLITYKKSLQLARIPELWKLLENPEGYKPEDCYHSIAVSRSLAMMASHALHQPSTNPARVYSLMHLGYRKHFTATQHEAMYIAVVQSIKES